MGKDSAARIELCRSFHQEGTFNVKVRESDFVPLWDGTLMCRSIAEHKLLEQWFSNLSWGPPTTAYFVCLPHLTHLIQLISSLVESARLEMGVAYERDIHNVWWLGVPRTGLRTTV